MNVGDRNDQGPELDLGRVTVRPSVHTSPRSRDRYARSITAASARASKTSPTWPIGHTGWAYRGATEFHARATVYLSEGLRRNERLMFVADDPRPDLWPARLQGEGRLQVLGTSDVYGANRSVDAFKQRDTFFGAVAEALAGGYSGIRVAADNTSLVTTPETLVAWQLWEQVADEFMRQNPMSALCSFDAERLAPETLAELLAVHPTRAPDRPGD